MGEKRAAASKQPPAARIPAPWGFRILVTGATAPGGPASGTDRGQGCQGRCQFCPGPSGAQARATPGTGARAAPAAQHQQEADSLPQVEMIAPGQRPVPAWVPSQLRARWQRHSREVHRVVALGLHGAARSARAGDKAGRGREGQAARVGSGSPGTQRELRVARPAQRHPPGSGTETPWGRNRCKAE